MRLLFRIMRGCLLLLVCGVLALWCTTPDVSGLAEHNPESTSLIELRREETRAAGREFRLQWHPVPLARIAPALVQAVLIAEDDKFFMHGGFDWEAIEEAVERGLSNRRFDRGASTITQQLARNLYLSPERSLLRKLREALITFRLEQAMGKERILELYLNVIEFGDQVFGVEAAARRYFRKTAVALAPEEAVRLASILTDPRRLSPFEQQLRWLNRKRRMISRRLHERRVVGTATWQALDAVFRP